ncbi:MAG: alpha/beta hydrolase [Bacteroidota bacterium]
MKKSLSLILFLVLSILFLEAQIQKEIFEFQYEGKTLNGVLNKPNEVEPAGLVLIIHGSGQTNAVAQEWYYDVRSTLVQAGFSVYMWDKMGCGKSEGKFDYHQSIQSSASEAIAAIEELKKQKIAGVDKIGLWGISRAGWINPLIINQYENIQFWISVSGVDEKENFKYLLEENLRINGHPEDSIQLLVEEWKMGQIIAHEGGSFEACVKATSNLSKNAFMKRFNGSEATKEDYLAWQKDFMQQPFDKQTGLVSSVENFDSILSEVQCPVLALFGEKDKNVDWKKTKALYENTLGIHTDLTIHSFPNCNHNLFECKTGGFYEMQDDNLPWNRCRGALEAMAEWLVEKGFVEKE